MKKTRVLISVVAFVVFLSSMSFANGLNLNGLGARAVAMGGAFVGLADDYSAVFWNPAGIAQFDKKYIGFSGFDIIPSMTYKLETPIPGVGVDAESVKKHYLGGMVAYYHPVSENMVAGLAVYSPSGLGIEWKGEDFAAISGGNTDIDWKSMVFVVTISPTLSYRISDQFSIGAALNINYGSFDLNMYAGSALVPFPPYILDLGQQEVSLKGWGFGATFGVLYKPSEMFSFGATFRTPSKISYSGETGVSGLDQLGISTTSDAETDITWPMWIAGGVALRPIKSLVFTLDVQWTDWSVLDVVELTFSDPGWVLMMGQSGKDEMVFHWKDSTQIRIGAEYMISPKFALRGGYYYDPTPTPDRTFNVLLPNATFNVITGGFGYNIDGIQIDFTFEYLMGKERDVPFLKTITDPDWEAAMPGVYNLNILVIEFGIGYRW